MTKEERAEKNQGNIDLGAIVNSAVEEGIAGIIQKHPRFAEQEKFLFDYLDKKKINQELNKYLEKSDGTIDLKDLTEKFGGYVAAGEFFNEKGKRLILRTGLQKESKNWFSGRLPKEILKGEEYLDETMGAFRDLYKLLQSGDYAKRMPEIAKAVEEVNDMGFVDAAINVLYENNMMNKGKYSVIKRAINEKVKYNAEYVPRALESVALSRRIAASILGITGLSFISANATITGNVIGTGVASLPRLTGAIVLLVSGVWLWFKNQKNNGALHTKVWSL
ncbi:MAG: hypothetical protein WCX73_01285 [Candidatus Pacearchaeota archaeon]